VTTRVVRDAFPAASLAVTVMRLSPIASWMAFAIHLASSAVPLSFALPLPPRSFAQRTWDSRSSDALPPMSTRPVGPMSVTHPMLTVGATVSVVPGRTPCACMRNESSTVKMSPSCNAASLTSFGVASTCAESVLAPPPQPVTAKYVTA